MTQWLGGVGVVLLVVAIAPASGPGLQRVFYAEISGITAERLTPRIVDTAKILSWIYISLTLACALPGDGHERLRRRRALIHDGRDGRLLNPNRLDRRLLLYLLVFSIGTLAFAAVGLDFVSSFASSAATINITGPGLGDIGAVENYAAMPDGGRIVSIVLMLAGRLEIFTVVALLAALLAPLRRAT